MTRHSMGRRPPRDGAEQDALTGWRHFYAYLRRAGVRAEVKRRVRRRERHEAKRWERLSEDFEYTACEHCAEVHDPWRCPEADGWREE